MKNRRIIGLVSLLFAGGISAETVFEGKDGLVVMEVESTASPFGAWIEKQDVDGYTGRSHLEFTGNAPAIGPAHSPLDYHFTVDREGVYALFIRARKRLDGEAADKCNDCYVRLEGDFFAAEGGAAMELLGRDTKLFGGDAEGWGWTQKLDDHKKYKALYNLKPGTSYTLVVSGRSQRFNMDRIVFHHESVNENEAKNPANAESKRVEMQISEVVSAPAVALWQGKGRIAISSDGNHHDHDDWAATPLSLALLAARGLQDKLVLYTYSDHVWGNGGYEGRGYEEMQISALEGKEQFGFQASEFITAVDEPEKAYNAMAAAINASSADNPLFIIGAGPMQVIGEGINRSDIGKRRYVTVISHSQWNNRHADHPGKDEAPHEGWTFEEMKESFAGEEGGNVTFVQILDQNGRAGYAGFNTDRAAFDWIKTSPARDRAPYKKGSWDWLYARQETCIKNNGKNFDPSDAGMVVFLLTGIEKTDPSMAREIMENPAE